MTSAMEKRNNPRCTVKASAVYFPFTSLSSYSCDATVLNSSEDGLYFESRHPLTPGQCICIRTKQVFEDMPAPSDKGGLKDLAMAQVRWCEPKKAGHFAGYGIGVKYM